jgi:long-subunit fatty acid transport protein
MRTTFSGAYVIGKKGLISVDYELVNYGKAKLKDGADGYDFYDENSEINQAYKNSGNLRIGGELVATNNFTVRGGFEYHGSAYNDVAFGTNQLNSDANMMVYAGGIGYRTGLFFADLTYRYSALKDYDYPYPIPFAENYPIPQAASFNTIKNDVIFTLGFKF